MKVISAAMAFFCILLALTACQAGAVANVLDLTATPSQPAASASPLLPTLTPSTAAPTLEPTLPSVNPTTEPTQPPVSPAAENPAPETTAANPTPASPDPAAISAPAEKTCKDMATFSADVTVPDGTFFRAGDAFTKTWRFHNTGDCTWTPAYSVIFSGGEIMSAPLSVPLPAMVAPGQQIDISIPMRAPTRGGEHVGNWEFSDETDRRFGTGFTSSEPFWVAINVSFVDEQGVAIPAPANNPVSSTTPLAAATTRTASSPLAGTTPGSTPASAPAQNAVPAGCAGSPNRNFESQVIGLINQARQQNGLPPLQENGQLDSAARLHSVDMACRNFLNHTGTDGSTWYDRLAAQGYAYNDALENIYAGSPDFGGDPQGAMKWWLNSAIHRANILNSEVTEIGVGYVANPQSDFGGYYTVVFARP